MLEPTSDIRLGELVTAYPGATKVLLRHDLDFCCGGKQTLARACEKKGLAVADLIDELKTTLKVAPDHVPWDQAPLSELLDHILETFHKPLPEDLEQLAAMSAKVLRVHGEKDPERLAAIHATINEVAADIIPHMMKEERVLFPWIRSGRQPLPAAPIAVMEADHETLGVMLDKLKNLTNAFVPPPEACTTWRNLYARLEKVDGELREHIHLENNVLHPRVLGR